MPQLRRIQVLYAKVEATEGTDPVPVAADALQLVEPATLEFGAEMPNLREDLHNQQLEPAGPLAPSFKWAEVTGRLYQRGKGSAYATTAGPEPHALLQGAGLSATFSTDHWDYDTLAGLAGGLKTLTFYCFAGLDTAVHVLHKILAARLSRLAFVYEAGAPGFIEFAARGEYAAPTDTTVIAPSYGTATPPLFAAAGSWALGSFSAGLVARAGVTIENTLAHRASANSSATRYALTGRRLGWTAEVEAARVADYDPFTKWASATQEALAIVLGAAGGNNRITISADKAQIAERPRYSERGGLMRFDLTGILDPSGTNRCKITYAA
jgi:hypothetical protein